MSSFLTCINPLDLPLLAVQSQLDWVISFHSFTGLDSRKEIANCDWLLDKVGGVTR